MVRIPIRLFLTLGGSVTLWAPSVVRQYDKGIWEISVTLMYEGENYPLSDISDARMTIIGENGAELPGITGTIEDDEIIFPLGIMQVQEKQQLKCRIEVNTASTGSQFKTEWFVLNVEKTFADYSSRVSVVSLLDTEGSPILTPQGERITFYHIFISKE